jgi:hypothetical protein
MTEGQRKRYGMLASGVESGKISMNKSFLEAKKGFSNHDGEKEDGFQGNIGDWITTAQDSGWIDTGLNMVLQNGFPLKEEDILPPPPPPAPPKNNIGWLGLTIGIVAIVILVNQISKDKK